MKQSFRTIVARAVAGATLVGAGCAAKDARQIDS